MNKLTEALEEFSKLNYEFSKGQKNQKKQSEYMDVEQALCFILIKHGFAWIADLSGGVSKIRNGKITYKSNDKPSLESENFYSSKYEKIGAAKLKKEVSELIKNYKVKINIKENSLFRLETKSFITQPNSSNGSPDFLIFFDKKIFCIETKSTENGSVPMMNAHIPFSNFIYIFTDLEKIKSGIHLGSNLLSDSLNKELDKTIRKKAKEFEKHINSEFIDITRQRNEQNLLGIKFYLRFATAIDPKNFSTGEGVELFELNNFGCVKEFIENEN